MVVVIGLSLPPLIYLIKDGWPLLARGLVALILLCILFYFGSELLRLVRSVDDGVLIIRSRRRWQLWSSDQDPVGFWLEASSLFYAYSCATLMLAYCLYKVLKGDWKP